jgi:hypothetical protein
MKALKTLSSILLIIGGLNWLLVGLFSIDVGMIFGGQGALISRIIYILVGLSAVYAIFTPCKGHKVEEKRTEPPIEPSAPQM